MYRLARFLLALLLSPALALAQSRYTLTDLGPALSVGGINDVGRVVGSAIRDGLAGPARFTNDGPQLLAREGQATAIAGNVIVGFAPQGPVNMEAFAFHPFLGLVPLGLLPGGTASTASAVNRRLTIVGHGDTPMQNFVPTLFAFGKVFSLPLLNGGAGVATAVSPHGRIVGEADISPDEGAVFHAVLWWTGRVHDLGTLGGPFSSAMGVNDQPLVVGWADSPTSRVAMTWTPRDGMQALPALRDFPYCQAVAINTDGVIVGRCDPDGFGTSRAVRWDRHRQIAAVGTLVEAAGWTLTEAADVNERGQIAGVGLVAGRARAFRLTPEAERVARQEHTRWKPPAFVTP